MNQFFAAANTESGFRSLFPSCFSPTEHRRIYILKGGPGTGKSTLMKQLGFTAEALGHETEYYYCSSDTDSLDGVRIPSLGVAILDGTPPHAVEPEYPGAVETLVDLGAAFDRAALARQRKKLVSLTGRKREAYRTAYRCLAAAGRVAREKDDLLAPAFLCGKADAAAGRLVASLKAAERGAAVRRYVSALGTHGAVHWDTLRERAKKIYAVTDKNGVGYLFMTHLYAALSERGAAMTVCETPLTHTRIEEIFVWGEDVLFAVLDDVAAQKADKIVNSARFVSREKLAERRSRLRFLEKCTETLIDGALASLAEAGSLHAQIEALYHDHVDFSEVDRLKNKLISEIFANNM